MIRYNCSCLLVYEVEYYSILVLSFVNNINPEVQATGTLSNNFFPVFNVFFGVSMNTASTLILIGPLWTYFLTILSQHCIINIQFRFTDESKNLYDRFHI